MAALRSLLFASIIFLFTISTFAVEVEVGHRYEIELSIQVIGPQGIQTISANDGYIFEIVGESSSSYNLKIYDREGNQVPGRFRTSRSNIDGNIIFPEMIETMNEAMAALESVQDCTHCESGVSGVEPETRPVSIGSNEVCAHFSKFKEAGVPEEPLKQALLYYQEHRDEFEDGRYISIADYSVHSSRERFYILDMQTGRVRKEKVSHGSGDAGGGRKSGDQNHDGMIDRCHHGNNLKSRKNMTRAGFFKTLGLYHSSSHTDINTTCGRQVEWPYLDKRGNNGMKMKGLTDGVNDEALSKGVVMHGAWYNSCGETMGRSYGCPAFEPDIAGEVINTIKGGNLYYSYTPICEELHSKVEDEVRGWEGMCQ